jgi:hypothetical protein
MRAASPHAFPQIPENLSSLAVDTQHGGTAGDCCVDVGACSVPFPRFFVTRGTIIIFSPSFLDCSMFSFLWGKEINDIDI